MDIAASSTEYLHIAVTAPVGIDLTASPVRIAVVPHHGNPATGDWRPAIWDGATARILIGPAGGALSLPAGGYWAWITWVAGSETPVCRSGRVRVY